MGLAMSKSVCVLAAMSKSVCVLAELQNTQEIQPEAFFILFT